MRGVVAGLVVVAAAAACVFVFMGKGEKRDEKAGKKPAKIREVTSAAAPTNNVEAVKKPKFPGAPLDWDKPYPPQAYRPDGSLKQHSRWVKVITNGVSKLTLSIEETTFSSHSDQQLAYLVNMQAGDSLVTANPVKFDESFVRSFKDSLTRPIEISDKDTHAQQELKKAVMEVRDELKARMDAGEDIAKIMNDAWADMRELSLYTREIEEMVHKARKESGEMSEADEEDLVKAANQMLSDRGIERQLALPSAIKARAQMISERRAYRAGRAE